MKKYYSSQEVANEIIKYHNSLNKPISNMRLQKILYFVQGMSYLKTSDKLFESNFEAWQYGPVDVDVYKEFAQNGSSPILNTQLPKSKLLSTDIVENNFVFNFEDYAELDTSSKEIVHQTVDQLIEKSNYFLVNASHAQDPWKNTYDKNNIHKEISDNMIKNFFMKAKFSDNGK